MTSPEQPRPLDPEMWRRVERVLDVVFDLEPSVVGAYLEGVYEDDPDLRPHVEALLRADARDSGQLEASADQLLAPGAGDDSSVDSGVAEAAFPIIPSFRIVREIGRGGMGTVYLAERADGQFTQRVAVKVVPVGLGRDEITQRFLEEREIHAQLEHPNIARLLDGGVTADGRPYFAMEYVDGLPITEYADGNSLDIVSRLELFEAMGRAVEHAQRHLVVHRDLKPSNVLVTAEGLVKLLDFGIAKIIEETDRDGALTRTGAHLLTPEYAAPEQFQGRPVTTATDVYALGVLLFELLTGHRPFYASGRSIGELERLVLESEPDTPVAAISRTTTKVDSGGRHIELNVDTVARARGVSPNALRRRLRGDLTTIVGKALRREPEERYPSAEALLADLVRYRQGHPVSAQPPTFLYRMKKYARRNRVGVVAVAVVVSALTAGFATTLWQAREAAREAERASAVRDFLIDLFRGAGPDAAGGEDLTASELLARGSAGLDEELEDQPEMRAELLRVVGRLYEELGNLDSAGANLEKALALRLELFGDRDERVAQSLADVAAIDVRRSRLDRADSLFTRALSIYGRSGSRDSLAIGRVLSDLALTRSRLGHAAEAESLLRCVVAADRRLLGTEDPSLASDLDNLGVLLTGMGRPSEALPLHQEGMELRRRLLAPDHSGVGSSLHNVAFTLGEMGDLDASREAYDEAIALRRRIYPGGHPHLAVSLRGLGQVLRTQGHLAAADSAFGEALEITRRLVGNGTEDVANIINDRGILAYQRGDYEAARAALQESLDIWLLILPPEHSTIATMRGNLAAVAQASNRLDVAQREYELVLDLHRRTVGDEHPAVALDLNNLGGTYRLLGRPREAIPLHEEAITIYTRAYGPDHLQVAACRHGLGSALLGTGEMSRAAEEFHAALEILGTQLPPNHSRVLNAQVGLAWALTELGRAEEALPLLEGVLGLRRSEEGTVAGSVAACVMARCLVALGRLDEAAPLVDEAEGQLPAHYGPGHPYQALLHAARTELEAARRRR